MNLPYTYELLAAADEQSHGLIKLRGIQADHEVRLMTQAGLVEATFNDGKEGCCTAITRVTEAGQTFLRALKDHTTPVEATLTASQAAVMTKWKANFDSGLIPFGAVA
jgi:hypothetical protein